MRLIKGQTYEVDIEWNGCPLYKCLSVKSSSTCNIGTGTFTFTSDELLDAIYTCGMPWTNLIPSITKKRTKELQFKKTMIEAALKSSSRGPASGNLLKQNPNCWNYLDPSEKRAVDYYLGMFFSKLISSKLFNVKYVVHLFLVEKMPSVSLIYNSKRRPDFVGFDASKNAYCLFEAKGRQDKKLSVLTDAINQLKAVSSINGRNPFPMVATMVYFNGAKNEVALAIEDPVGEGRKDEIEIDVKKLLRTFFEPIQEVIYEEDGKQEDSNFIYRDIILDDESIIRVTLSRDVDHWLKDQRKFDIEMFKEKAYSVSFI